MDLDEIKRQLKVAHDMLKSGDYTEELFYSHMLTLISECDNGPYHKEQMERLIFKTWELREVQNSTRNGHLHKLGECKKLGEELDRKLTHLQTQGYSIERFKQQQPKQNSMFD